MALALVKSASQLREEQRVSREFVEQFGLRLQRGGVSEICGAASSGKTALALAFLATLTQNGEICAVVDVSDGFNPESARENGLMLENTLWIKCGGELEKSFTVTDYLVQAKGFGAIWLNLSLVPRQHLIHIPSSFWYRFRTGVGTGQTMLIVTVREPLLGSASSQSYTVSRARSVWNGVGRFKLLREFFVDLNSKKPMSGGSVLTRITSNYV
ncbi:MAG: hypothetical protein IPN69_06395 [Acidobacteria bacterium]|nr:hypothetical protein [Acidobacteriota bacterium]